METKTEDQLFLEKKQKEQRLKTLKIIEDYFNNLNKKKGTLNKDKSL